LQSQEQDIAQRLISEAASKLSMAVKTGDLQTAIVAQTMLDSRNDKLNEAMKQLVNVRAYKEKVQSKLMKAQGTLRETTVNAVQMSSQLDLLQKRETQIVHSCVLSGYAGEEVGIGNAALASPICRSGQRNVMRYIFVLFCNTCYSQ